MLAFLETVNVESGESSLPDFDSKNEVNLFFKYYDPRTKIMSYCGNAYVDLKSQPSSLFPMLCERAGLPKGTKLLFYEVGLKLLLHHPLSVFLKAQRNSLQNSWREAETTTREIFYGCR